MDDTTDRILLIDDDYGFRQSVGKWLLGVAHGYEVVYADTLKRCMTALLQYGPFDWILCDLKLGDGCPLLNSVQQVCRVRGGAKVIVISAWAKTVMPELHKLKESGQIHEYILKGGEMGKQLIATLHESQQVQVEP